ncbi:hypothetical protein [Neomegalonema sp.]|uniref:hypothetical protein n=1 Tax=Neomegalonema sp. TaxID=2039713 RepID=UPI002605B766|nr:hypothetical protein [Neomegalonema sp.]MDD2869669.1 hypothetical protein [Neomegalonema sp.]
MKKILMFILTVAFFAQVHAQRYMHQDSVSVGTPYSDYKRAGVAIMGRAESSLFRIALMDSSGVLYFAEAVYDSMTYDTTNASTTWDTLAFTKKYEFFNVFCDDVNKPFLVSFGADTTHKVRVAAGGILPMSVVTDTVTVRLESGTSVITVDAYNRKRY